MPKLSVWPKLKAQLRRLSEWQYFPFVLLALLLIPFYLIATSRFGDDAYFHTDNPLKDGLLNHLSYQYNSWSSRLIIMTVTIALNVLPIVVWRTLDLAVWLLAGICISKLFVRNPRTNYFVAGCMALYPYWQLATAGWVATTCGYSWPLAFGLFVFSTLKHLFENRRLPWYRYALLALAFLYATDAEQMCVIIACVLAFLAASHFLRRTAPNPAYTGTVIVLFVLTLARLAFTLTTPGNHVRMTQSLHLIWGFESYTLWDKLLLGFDFAIIHYLVCTLGLFPLFSYLLMISVWRGNKGLLARCVSAVPLASSIVLTATAGIRVLTYMGELLALRTERGFINAIFSYVLLPGGADMRPLFIIFFLSIIISLFLAFRRRTDKLTASGIMLLGFGSQLMLGLSPSIYGSALRTFIFAAFGMIIVSLRMYEDLDALRRFRKGSRLIFSIAIAVNYALTFAIGVFKLGGP